MAATRQMPGAFPVLTCREAGEFERRLLGGDETSEWKAMHRAGRGIGRAILADAEEGGGIGPDGRVLVLCGKGHNGGDALIAAGVILESGPQASAIVLVVPDFSALRPLVRRVLEALLAAHGSRIECQCVSGAVDGRDAGRVRELLGSRRFDACLDGLFGMQFRPPFRPPADWLIPWVNEHAGIRLRAAVDLPSGVGDASAEEPFRADFTYAAGVAKRPIFEPRNRDFIGRMRFVDVGFFDGEVEARSERTPALTVLAPAVLEAWGELRPTVADKRSFGHLFIVSGARGMSGAVLMAVESALLSGVGLVTAFVPESVAPAAAARLPEAMWVPMPETLEGGLALEGRGAVLARAVRCTALLSGPGLGRERETQALVRELLQAIDVPAVLDGDALQPDIVTVRKGAGAALVVTPHAGEFARISGTDRTDDEFLVETAGKLGAVVVLKGSPTRICAGEAVHVSPFGGPVLSRGGSGDFLAGLIGGLAATGMEPLLAAARGTAWHGMAADALARAGGQASATVTRLSAHLAPVLREAGRQHG